MTPFLNSIFKWQPKLHTLLWCSQQLLLLSFQEGPFTSLLIHQPPLCAKYVNYAYQIMLWCVCMCVRTRYRWQTLYPNIMQTLCNDLLSAVSLKKNVVCFRSIRTSIPPNKYVTEIRRGGNAAGGGWITGTTETSCSGAYWSYLGYLHIIFRVKSGTKITATSETGRGCSQFLPEGIHILEKEIFLVNSNNRNCQYILDMYC